MVLCMSPLPIGSAGAHSLSWLALQIRKISVKQVISPIIFDNLRNPIKGGLYDPAFGPLDAREK